MKGKLTECPNCLGVGEELHKGRFKKTCQTCKGDGMVDEQIAEAYLSSLKYYNDDEFEEYY